MKSETLENQVIRCAQVNRNIILPSGERTSRKWPLCMTCFKEVDAVDLKNVNNKSCEIVAKCTHSKDPDYIGPMFEDSIRVTWQVPVRDMSANPLEDKNVGWAIQRAMADMTPFLPEHQFDTSARR